MTDATASGGPLHEYRVLDLGRVIAGPHVGQLLGDMGADVIHVERPGLGDDSRRIPPFLDEVSLTYLISNRNKRSITLNLKTDRGREIVKDLARQVDVVIESNRPGVAARLGIDYPTLSAVNPRLVMTSISGFGQTGPARSLAGYNQIAQAEGGMMSLTGMPDGPALRTAAIVGDYLASLYAAFGTMVALMNRERTGQGQFVDTSLYESMVSVLGPALQEYLSFGVVRQRTGNWAPTMAPSDVYACSDGPLMIVAGNDAHWASLCALMGREDLKEHPDFAQARARVANVARVDEVVGRWARDRSRAEVAQTLAEAGVPCARIRDIGEVAEAPQTKARDLITKMAHPQLGEIETLGVLPKLSLTPGSIRRPPPALGEHNEEIYVGLLGLSGRELEALAREGVI